MVVLYLATLTCNQKHFAVYYEYTGCSVSVNYNNKTSEHFNFKQDQTLLWTCVTGAHLYCVNNQYAKFKYTGMKSVLATDYTKYTKYSTVGGVDMKMSTFNAQKYTIKRAQNLGCTCSVCELS